MRQQSIYRPVTINMTFETTTSRSTIKDWLHNIDPDKVIAPYGINPEYFSDGKIITRPDYAPITGTRRTNDQIHAKLILADDVAITGSCNFTPTSVNDNHEIAHRITDNETITTLTQFFNTIWKHTTPFRSINDTC